MPVPFRPEPESHSFRRGTMESPLSARLLRGIGLVVFIFTAVTLALDIYDIHREAKREMLLRSRVVAQELIAFREVIAHNQERINTDPVTGNTQFKHLNPASVGSQAAAVFNETTQFSLKQTRLNPRNPANQPDPTEIKMLEDLMESPQLSEIWREEFLADGWYFRYMIPVYIESSCLPCHGDPAGEKDISGYPKEGLKLGAMAGAISLRMPMESYQKALGLRIWGRITIALVLLIVTRWIIARLTRRLVAQPMQALTEMARQLGEGDWGAVKPVTGTGEIQVLSRTFDQMARQLKEAHDTLEEKVRERTKRLSDANRELERANRFKSEVLANISHELRTPLTSIIAFTEMLMSPATGQLSQKQREYLEDIAESSRQLLSEVTDLLTMARFEAGKLELNPEPLDMVEVIQDCAAQLQALAKKKKIDIVFPLEKGEWWVLADRPKVRHILNNLLNNALRFSIEGEEINISLERKQCTCSKAPVLQVSVADRGPGIEPANHDLIFEKFHQLGRPDQGAGLGLALARELVLLHGGEIWVESEPGRGSTFRFTLPFKDQTL